MRTGAACAIAGSVLLLVGTSLHPMDADPADALAAFSEYAADTWWVATHLIQLAGVVLMTAALLLLSQHLETGPARSWSRLASAGAIAGLAIAAALQAVDGIALKATVNAWAAAPAEQKEAAFQAAFAVRQVEVGFASILSLVLGLSLTLYGVALWVDRSFPAWLGGVGVVGGLATAVSGVVMAHTGFSALAMAINMPSSVLLLTWIFALGVLMWRRGGGVRGGPVDTRP